MFGSGIAARHLAQAVKHRPTEACVNLSEDDDETCAIAGYRIVYTHAARILFQVRSHHTSLRPRGATAAALSVADARGWWVRDVRPHSSCGPRLSPCCSALPSYGAATASSVSNAANCRPWTRMETATRSRTRMTRVWRWTRLCQAAWRRLQHLQGSSWTQNSVTTRSTHGGCVARANGCFSRRSEVL